MEGRQPFEADDEIQAKIERLTLKLRKYQRGELATWAEIEGTIGSHRDDPGSRHIIRQARQRLFDEDGVATQGKSGQGVYLLTQSEQATEAPRRRQKRALRQTKTGLAEVVATDMGELSDYEQRIRAFHISAMGTQRERMQSDLRRRPYTRESNPKPARFN